MFLPWLRSSSRRVWLPGERGVREQTGLWSVDEDKEDDEEPESCTPEDDSPVQQFFMRRTEPCETEQDEYPNEADEVVGFHRVLPDMMIQPTIFFAALYKCAELHRQNRWSPPRRPCPLLLPCSPLFPRLLQCQE
jgi:hypothetical protein